jgi:tetratricopeptide (TPR) repeat protein
LTADETESRGHYAMSCALLYDRSYEKADWHAARGLELSPAEYHNICNRGYCLMSLGRVQESLSFFGQSLRRDPLAPSSCLLALGLIEYLNGDYGQSSHAMSKLTTYQLQRSATIAAASAQMGFDTTSKNSAQYFKQIAENIPNVPSDSTGSQWKSFWSRVYPYLAGDSLEHILEGLKKAHLPV